MRVVVFIFLLGLLISCTNSEKPVTGKEATPARPADSLPANAVPDNQVNAYASVDISPMDMSYFPVEYPKFKTAGGSSTPPPVMRVIYSRPHLSRRKFDAIVKVDQPWRMGANESSEIEFFRSVTIQGKNIAKGRYILYAIPHPGKWDIVINSNTDTWGLQQDSAKDVNRFSIPVSDNNPPLEYFTMVFEKSAGGADLIIAWDDRVARLPIRF